MDVHPGTILGERYRLLRLLGRGAMGEVWVAHHETLHETVAVKLLTAQADPDETPTHAERARARFQLEAQIAARLSRKTRHIVRVIDHGREADHDYLVMELLDGETLDALMQRESQVAPEVVSDVVKQIARALTVAHEEGIAHRDLKPANVFLTTDEDGRRVAKLLDFGIARVLHRHRIRSSLATARGIVVGTPAYMSPEQARGAMTLDHRCDLWALATIAYEALSGHLPVQADGMDELLMNLCRHRLVPIGERDSVLSRFAPFFARAFHESLGERFSTAAELAAAFEEAVGPTPASISTSAMPVAETIVPAPERSNSSRRRTAMAVLGVMGALLAGEMIWLATSANVRPPGAMDASVAHAPPAPSSAIASSSAPPTPVIVATASPATSSASSVSNPAPSAVATPVVSRPSATAVRVPVVTTGAPPVASSASAPPVAPPPLVTAMKQDPSEVF